MLFLRRPRPKLICVEHNSGFRPPMRMIMPCDRHFVRDNISSYHGASLQAWADGLFGHRLVACTVAGVPESAKALGVY